MTPAELAAYAISESIIKVAPWAIAVIAVIILGYVIAYLLDPDARFDRHVNDAIRLTRPNIGDEAEAFLKARWRE